MDKILDKAQNRGIQYNNMIAAFESQKVQQGLQRKTLKATKMRALVNSYNLTSAYKSNAKVAFTGEEFPQEFLFALKITPINLQTMSALFSRSNTLMLNNYLKLADEYYLTRDICSNVRSAFGIGLADCLPNPDIVFGNSAPCDGFSKLAYYMSKFYNCKFLIIDTPNFVNDESILFLTRQIQVAINEIENELNIKLDEEELLKVVNYSNEAKEYFIKVIELVKKFKLPLIQRELYEFIVSNLWGSKDFVGVCKTLYEEALEQSQKQDSQKSSKRVLWIGQVPNYGYELMDYLEKELDLVFYASLNHANFCMLDINKPLESMAERLMMYSWDPFKRSENIVNIYNMFGIKGIIMQNAWGCRNLIGINNTIRSLTLNCNLKYLTLDADFMDKDKFSFSQVKNRIDAFIEII